MSRPSNHTSRGLIFVGACCAIAVAFFIAIRLANHVVDAPAVAANATSTSDNSVAFEPDAVADTDVPPAPQETPSPAPGAVSTSRNGVSLDFADYPVRTMNGPIHLPSFVGKQREYAGYRTMLLQAAQAGANFAGHYALTSIGCGMECTSSYIIDEETGAILDFPLGGEEYLNLDLRFKPNSSLIHAYWHPSDEYDTCSHATYVLQARGLTQIGSGESLPCPEAETSGAAP